jgi:hypothetical protein
MCVRADASDTPVSVVGPLRKGKRFIVTVRMCSGAAANRSKRELFRSSAAISRKRFNSTCRLRVRPAAA